MKHGLMKMNETLKLNEYGQQLMKALPRRVKGFKKNFDMISKVWYFNFMETTIHATAFYENMKGIPILVLIDGNEIENFTIEWKDYTNDIKKDVVTFIKKIEKLFLRHKNKNRCLSNEIQGLIRRIEEDSLDDAKDVNDAKNELKHNFASGIFYAKSQLKWELQEIMDRTRGF